MRSFDQRFKEKAPAELIEQLTALPAGSTATIREVVFSKDSRYRWHNDFRVGMTNREVASVLAEGTHTITTPEGARA
jgi:hypothetical protein